MLPPDFMSAAWRAEENGRKGRDPEWEARGRAAPAGPAGPPDERVAVQYQPSMRFGDGDGGRWGRSW